MPEMTSLQQRLRTYGAAVEAERHPVDVDAILFGMVDPPRRRVRPAHRRAFILVVALAAALLVSALVYAWPRSDRVIIVPAGPARTAPMPDLSSATFAHTMPDGSRTVAAWKVCDGGRCTYAVWVADVRTGRTLEVASAMALDDHGGVLAGVDPELVMMAMSSSPTAVRVDAQVRLDDGAVVTDHVIPVDGVAFWLSSNAHREAEGPLGTLVASRPYQAFDAGGEPVY